MINYYREGATMETREENKFYESFINLIRWASRKYSRELNGRFDYWDFFEEGILILSLCLCKWREKDKDLKDKEGFQKYFKVALFNRFRQIQVMSHAGKRKGVHVSIEQASNVSCDGGFGDILFKELVDYVSIFLTKEEERLFSLMVFPPEDLLMDAIHEYFRKQKYAMLSGNKIFKSYGSKSVRISCKCFHRYINKRDGVISETRFFSILRSIRRVVSMVLYQREAELYSRILPGEKEKVIRA